MKRLSILVVGIMVVVMGIAAPKPNVTLNYKNFSLSFAHQPLLTNRKLLPFIDGEISGSKERIGIYFGQTEATSPVLEILDGKGSPIKSLSVNDIIGKGISKEENLLPSASSLKPRRAENIYSVRLPQGDVRVIVKAIATGDESKNDQELVITFSLSAKASLAASLRLTLPYVGTGEAGESGMSVTSKNGTTALAASVFPFGNRISIEKNKFVITSGTQAVEAGEENAFVWLVIKGVTSSSSNDVRTQVQKIVKHSVVGQDEPRLVVVNTADKERLQQSDTAAYTIICTNVGTGDASNVVLGNPIPKGTKYLQNSATTLGTKFEVTKGLQSAGEESLKWTLVNPLKPGEERMLSFKLILQ